MSVIEESRRVMQDFLAPELRAISARLDALEKRHDVLDRKLDDIDKRSEKRTDDLAHRLDRQHDEVMASIRQVIDWNSVQQRLARLESKEVPQQQ